MKTLLTLLLALVPMGAAAKEPASGVYGGLVRDLMKNCEGADKKIAVANFSYQDGRSSADGGIVSGRVTTELVRLKKFKVTERKEIEKVFGELKLQASGAIDADSVKSLGKMLGADWLVLGTLTEMSGRKLEINARLVGVESAEIISAASVKVKKDWRDRPEREEVQDPEFRKNGELDEYDKAIHKYMDEKAGKKKQTIKQPPSF